MFCIDCGLKAYITNTLNIAKFQVTVKGEENEIQIAWELFQEELKLKTK